MPIEFYFGDREMEKFDLELHGGKARLTCTVIERWEERFGRVLKCGNRRSEVITQKCGISLEERQDLEATVKGSLGLSGIAELKSEIKGKFATKIEFNESTDVKKEFKFEAPKCGRLDLMSYQLKRVYRFSYDDARFFHKDSWTRNFSEWVDRIYDDSRKYPYDPNCGCKPKSEPEIDGKTTIIFDEKIAMHTGFSQTDEGIKIPDLDLSLSRKNIGQMVSGDFRLHQNIVPPHLLFLAGVTAEILTVRMISSTADRVAENLPERDVPRESESEKTESSVFMRLEYFLVGVGIGALIGFVFAPKSGEETREYLTSKADEGRDYAQKKARELRERAEDLIERSKEIMARQKDRISAGEKPSRTTNKKVETA
jgi:gas vesicle protein